MDRSPREHQPEAPRASPAVVRNQLAPRPHARGPQRRRRVSAARTAYYLLPHAVGPALYEPRTRSRPLDAPREAISRLAESWAGPPRPARFAENQGVLPHRSRAPSAAGECCRCLSARVRVRRHRPPAGGWKTRRTRLEPWPAGSPTSLDVHLRATFSVADAQPLIGTPLVT